LNFDPKTAVYTPPESSQYGLDAIEDIKKNQRRGLGVGIEGIRDYFAPLRPGQLAMLFAQTSNYKTGMLHYLENVAVNQLEAQGRYKEVIVHISVEENIEEQSFLELGRRVGQSAAKLAGGQVDNWDRLKIAAIEMGKIPVYRIGESMARADDYPLLTVTNMIKAVDVLRKGEVTGKPLEIAGLFFDYLQAFPFDPEIRQKGGLSDQRRLQVRNDVYHLRHAAALFKCPIWVAVQAKQTLAGTIGQIEIPGVYDGAEAKDISDRADRIWAQWMPKMTHPLGTEIKHKGRTLFIVEEDILVIRVLKQKPGLPSGKMWVCRINFDDGTICPYETYT